MNAGIVLQPREANCPDPNHAKGAHGRQPGDTECPARGAAEGSPEQGAAGSASCSPAGAAEEDEERWPGCSGALPAPHSPAAPHSPVPALSTALALELLWERRLTSLGLILLKTRNFPSVLRCNGCVTAMSALFIPFLSRIRRHRLILQNLPRIFHIELKNSTTLLNVPS